MNTRHRADCPERVETERRNGLLGALKIEAWQYPLPTCDCTKAEATERHFELDPHLIRHQGLSDKEVEQIYQWHDHRLNLFKLMEQTDDPAWLHRLAGMIEEIEYELQRLWHFPRSRDHHTWWNRVPKCRCPKMDNAERFGTPYRIINGACPVHGEMP